MHASGVLVAIIIREAYSLFEGYTVPFIFLLLAISLGYIASYSYKKGFKIPILTQVINSAEREKDKLFPGRGAIRFFTGSFLSLLIFRNRPDIVVASIIVLSLGDSASTLAGVTFGKHKIFYNKDKSFEGFLGGLIASVAGLLILTPLPIPVVLGASFAGLLFESLPLGLDDNLTIPVASGFTIWIITSPIII
jgi:dolichol kinase